MTSEWSRIFLSDPPSLDFCSECNSILPVLTTKCDVCGSIAKMEPRVIVTETSPGGSLDAQRAKQRKKRRPTNALRAKIDTPCPECGNPQTLFYTRQLRSADEGQTVFYECEECGHTYNQNT